MDFFSPAQIIGYIAFVLGVSSFLQRRDRNLRILNASECLAYTAHFFLLGNPAASGSALLSAIRSIISLKYNNATLAAVFIALNVVVGITQATAWYTWLPVIACCIATYGIFLLQGIGLRLTFLTATVLWLINNICSGSIGGTALETVIFTTNGTMILRMLKEKHANGGGTPGDMISDGLVAFSLAARDTFRALVGGGK
jgi:hypothetical protein